MGNYQKQRRLAQRQENLLRMKARTKAPAGLNIKQKVNSGELSVKAAMNKLAGVPGGRDTSTWTWLQKRMNEKK